MFLPRSTYTLSPFSFLSSRFIITYLYLFIYLIQLLHDLNDYFSINVFKSCLEMSQVHLIQFLSLGHDIDS